MFHNLRFVFETGFYAWLLLTLGAPSNPLWASEPQDAARYLQSGGVTPQQAEAYLESISSPLIRDNAGDHVNSYYYFGTYAERTLIGLERVRGDDYSQHFTLLVFHRTSLLGYYTDIVTLPLFLGTNGELLFPRGSELAHDIFIDQDAFPLLCMGRSRCIEWTAMDSIK